MSVQPAGDDHHDHVHRTPHQDQQQARSHIQDANTAPGSASSAQALGRLARDLQQQLDPQDTLQHVAEWAVQTIPGAQHVSVSLVHRRREITSAAATGDVARRFDELQQEVGQGPCLMAMYDHQTMRVEDLATDERWPLLAQQWAKAGARSALCLQLFVQGQDLGALNVLSEHVGAFDDESEQWGLLVASHAAVAVAGALKIDGLG
ncbi:MAG: GAF domain-containing protein, partial [Janthinobacterium lividum]